ncbi:hypothetical protein [Serratia plymuthica]
MVGEKKVSLKKAGLPVLIAGVICGYATNYVPVVFPDGEFREWAYRSMPLLSMCILFIIKILSDLGAMTLSDLIFSTFCASPEKKRLSKIISDDHVSDEVKARARTRYSEISASEIQMGSRRMDYLFKWLSGTPSQSIKPISNKEEN